MRLIDADALIEKLKKDPLFPLVEQYGLTGVIDTQQTVDTSKELFCTVNVNMDIDEIIERIKERGWEPVEHGHWIKIGEIDRDGNQYYQCSKCGKGEIHVPIIDVNYCWNCGARMDEEADHDDHL